MIIFCPICSSALSVAPDKNNQNRLECRNCPYINPVTIPYFDRTRMKQKEVDDVLGGEGSWENVDRQDNVQCHSETCDNMSAYFYQVQIRSADEPMTTFYRCTKCGARWRSN